MVEKKLYLYTYSTDIAKDVNYQIKRLFTKMQELSNNRYGLERTQIMEETLIENIDKVHTTEMGVDRIRRNLGLNDKDVVEWCKERILDKNSIKERHGKNWYVHADGCVITVNAGSYTIITCHKE